MVAKSCAIVNYLLAFDRASLHFYGLLALIAYNGGMLPQYFLDPWLPGWMRRTHPLVRHYLRRPTVAGLRYVVFGSAVGLFLLFGGLSLPLLYLFLWLSILMQQALTMAGRLHDAQVKQTWDVLRVAPFSPRELLLTTWAGSFWQINQTWVMGMYRLLHGIAVIGIMVFGLWFAEFPVQQSALVLLVGLLAIILQPVTEVYFSGMVGLVCAEYIRRNVGAVALALLAVLLYWCACVALVITLIFADTNGLSLEQLLIALAVPSLLPLVLGQGALRLVEARLR